MFCEYLFPGNKVGIIFESIEKTHLFLCFCFAGATGKYATTLSFYLSLCLCFFYTIAIASGDLSNGVWHCIDNKQTFTRGEKI
jgi:hypothetical protein